MQDKESSLYMSQNVNYGLQNTQLELAKEYEKKNISAKKELYVYQEKEKIKEINRELKKAQYENIFVGIDGNLYAQTYNTSVQSFPRYIANFQNPELCILHRIAHKEDIIYCFKCTINEKQKSLFFDGKKFGSDTYILNKLSTIGGQILTDKSIKQKEILRKILNMLSENSKYEFWIPEKNGWYINEYNKIKFCGDDYTWEKIAPLAK